VTFYRNLVAANHLDISQGIIDSFTHMLNSPAFNRAVVLRTAQEKSGRTFESLYANYNDSQTTENQNRLAEELLKVGVIEHHSTRLLHPLAFVKSLWDQKPDLRPTLLESLPSYFMLMADQIGKCAAGATGRTIIMSRLLAEALIKTPIK